MLRVVFFLFVMLICFQCEEPEPDLFVTIKNNYKNEIFATPFFRESEKKELGIEIDSLNSYQKEHFIVQIDSSRIFDFYSSEILCWENIYLHIDVFDKEIYDSIIKLSLEMENSRLDYLIVPYDSLVSLDFIIEYP